MNLNQTEPEPVGVVEKFGYTLVGPPIKTDITVYKDTAAIGWITKSGEDYFLDTCDPVEIGELMVVLMSFGCWLKQDGWPWPWEVEE